MKKADFEKAHGKLPSDAVYIDLDEQQAPAEPMTEGLTDSQISRKTLEQWDSEINSAMLGLGKLRETVSSEEARVVKLRNIRNRRLQL